MTCSNIEPAVLSNTSLRLSFPDLPSDAMDPRYGMYSNNLIMNFVCRITLPVAIVNLINNTNVMHGEVLVYDVDVTAATAANETVGCTIVTLRFTEFTGMCWYHPVYTAGKFGRHLKCLVEFFLELKVLVGGNQTCTTLIIGNIHFASH